MFGRATITVGISPHSSSILSAARSRTSATTHQLCIRCSSDHERFFLLTLIVSPTGSHRFLHSFRTTTLHTALRSCFCCCSVNDVSRRSFAAISSSCRQDFLHGNRRYIHTRMWANAQPDGRPAEHRWRPLFNAAKFG